MIVTVAGDCYYLHRGWKKPRPLAKLKGIDIVSVAWPRHDTSDSTGLILLVASDGSVYQCELVNGVEKYVMRLIKLPVSNAQVTGAHYELLTEDCGTVDNVYFTCVTDECIYYFHGLVQLDSSISLEPLFQSASTSGKVGGI